MCVLIVLGAFAKFRKVTTDFVMSIRVFFCPSAWNNSAPTRRAFMKIDIGFFKKSV